MGSDDDDFEVFLGFFVGFLGIGILGKLLESLVMVYPKKKK